MAQITMTHEEAIKRAEYIGQVAEEGLFDADRNNGYSSKLKDAIHETQIHRLLRPKKYGGFGMGHDTMAEVVRTVAQHSVSGAWVTYFMPLHETWVAMLPPKAREEIFVSDQFVSDIFFPIGKIEYVEGGVRLSGEWKWGSGIDFCGWIGLGAMVDVPGQPGGPQPCLVTVKVSEGEIVKDWNAFGLNGTGSNTFRINNVFSRWDMVLPLGAIKKNTVPIGGDYDPSEPVYRVPFGPAFCIGFGAICVGAAQRLQRELHERIRTRQRVVLGMKEWESPVAQRNLGEVTTQVETIEALYGRYVKQLKDWCTAGKTTIEPEEEARMAAWRAYISRTASQIGFRSLELLGGAAAYRGDLVEVFARDLLMISIHVGMAYEDHMMFYGRAQYGLSQHPLV